MNVRAYVEADLPRMMLIWDQVVEDGATVNFDEGQEFTSLTVTLSEGEDSATCWGCDLTYDYVKINGDYRT